VQIPTKFYIGRRTTSLLLNVHSVSEIRQIEVHTAEPSVPPSRLEVEIAIAKLKQNKSPGSDQIPSELIQAGDETLLSAIHKHIKSICNKKELSYQFKKSFIIPIYKKGDKTDCNNYCGISLLSTSYKISSNIIFSGLSIDYIQTLYRHYRL
jgi:hypothetical protein